MSNNNEIELNPYLTETKPSTAIKLVTVHGTGAGDVTGSGDKWWQLGSVFLNGLQSRLELDPSEVEIVPFQWDEGPNSEEKRRTAGLALAAKLKSYEEAEQDYYLIGHSHGGSVIYNALLNSVANKSPFKRLKLWCTVGTPFLDYRPNTFLFQRLKSIGLTLYTSGIVSFVLGLYIVLIDKLKTGLDSEIVDMGYAMIIFGLCNYSALWLYELRKKSWFTRNQKKQVEEIYGERWCGLWHKEDEAISALNNIKSISAPIIPNSFLHPIVAIIQLSLVILVGVYFAYDVAFDEGKALKEIAVDLLDGIDDGGIGSLAWMTSWMIVVFYIPVIWILTKVLSLLATLLGRPLAFLLNNVVWISIKKRAWGDDLLKEDVHAVSSHPPEFMHKCDYLCEDIATPLRKHSEKNAINTLHKVRIVLGMSENTSSKSDIRTELSESLNWQELIHTSYFDVPEFVDVLAKSLKDAGLCQPKKLV